METALDRINRTLIQHRVKNNIKRWYFRSPETLSVILSENEVRNVVSESGLQDFLLPDIVRTVCNGMRIIFAILIELRTPRSIQDFIDEGILDSALPLEITGAPRHFLDGQAFFDVQWEFIPYKFAKSLYRRVRDEYVLPIVDEKRLESLDGSFGMISEIKVAPELHSLTAPSQKDHVLILKKLKGEASEPALDVKFKNEIECLGILRRLQHPNIVELLCSFTYLGEYNLVFPKYPLDLERFLKQEEPFGEFIREQTFCDALQGLASALDSVHNVKLTLEDHEVNLHRIGYHHDLRPSNVLVAHNTFLLADFGLARVKDMQTGSKTNFKETKGDYFAPECQNKDFVNQVVGRPIDIWAFGCMVIDIVTYMKRGAKGFHEAREERSVEVIPGWDNCRFYYNGSLRPAVIDHVGGMTRDDGASGEAAGLLQVAKMMLSIDPRDRIAAHQASKHISYVATKSWFYAATKSFEKYIAAVEVDDSSGPSTLDLWFLSNKLNAWGDVLGLTCNQTRYDGFDDSVNVADGIESNLQSGLKNIESSLQTALEERVWARPGLDLNLNPHFNLQETIRQTVERLVQHLKPKCQKRLETICRCTMLAERNIEGTSRYGDSLGEREPGYQDLAAIAAVKKLQAAFAKLATVEPTYQALLLDESRLRGTHTSHGHEFGYLKMPPGNKEQSEQQEVLIERVPYSSKWKEQSAEEKVVRIGSLAKLLSREQQPIGFRFLRCKGLIMSDSEQAYKVLFELPNRGYGIRRQPKSLLTLLTETTKSWKPDLQQKIRLAQGLVLAVQALHSASWLHKALCSQNVLFFPSSAQKLDDYDLSDLYLVNFRMSRPDGKIWITDGPDTMGVHDYQHPDYIEIGKRFRKSYDIYSLGIVLLEIATWKPLRLFTERHNGENPEAFRNILITKYVPRLSKEVGSKYCEVVERCLSGYFDAIDEEDPAPGDVPIFYKAVVEPMSELFVG